MTLVVERREVPVEVKSELSQCQTGFFHPTSPDTPFFVSSPFSILFSFGSFSNGCGISHLNFVCCIYLHNLTIIVARLWVKAVLVKMFWKIMGWAHLRYGCPFPKLDNVGNIVVVIQLYPR